MIDPREILHRAYMRCGSIAGMLLLLRIRRHVVV